MYKITILFSGGMDSSVLLAWCKKQGIECQPLFVDYGQVTASKEFSAAEIISKKLNMPLEKITISDVSSLTKNQITDPSHSKNPFYPNRNLLLLTLGSLHAYENKNDGVGIGAIRAEGSTPFPDLSQTFFDEFTKIVETSLNYKLAIITPFIELTKKEVAKIGKNLDVPFELTYSCLTNNNQPCGFCESCISRNDVLGE
jgi:7-cyano-7-deazaguanine synthase